jgi:hypothetical protein
MSDLIENIIRGLWNILATPARGAEQDGLNIGHQVFEEKVSGRKFTLPNTRRTEQISIVGVTGSGKTSLLRLCTREDVSAGRGWLFFDLHGDTTPYLLSMIAAEEQRTGRDLSKKLIIVSPADPDFSAGMNFLEQDGTDIFVQIAEITAILKKRFLETAGARTEELLRNTLFVLAANRLTIVEASALLTNSAFRSQCLRNVSNAEVRNYFEYRYDQASAAMQAVMRDPILNRISLFVSDPRFRHLVGQHSTFDVREALDRGFWIILDFDKGKLGEQTQTLASLFLTKFKSALFGRSSRELYTFYCDELPNLVAFSSGLEGLLSEARKFGVSIFSANQYMDQFSPEMRAALQAVSTHLYFRLSSADADRTASALDGGKSLSHLLKNLPNRQAVVKVGPEPWKHIKVRSVRSETADHSDLYERSRRRWARPRTAIERAIEARVPKTSPASALELEESLHEWD